MYDKEDYRANKPSIMKHYEKNGFDGMSSYSAMTGIPITVVYEYIEEDYPELKDMIRERIRIINEFFGIK